jgi:hypothetical protein
MIDIKWNSIYRDLYIMGISGVLYYENITINSFPEATYKPGGVSGSAREI